MRDGLRASPRRTSGNRVQSWRNGPTLEVVVHREPPGYWAEVSGLEGCFASGVTLDELLAALQEAVSLYLGEHEPERLLARLTGLRLEVDPDLKPADADEPARSPTHRKRQSHRDDWPPRMGRH